MQKLYPSTLLAADKITLFKDNVAQVGSSMYEITDRSRLIAFCKANLVEIEWVSRPYRLDAPSNNTAIRRAQPHRPMYYRGR